MSLLLTLAFACTPTPTPEVAAAAFPITALPDCELLPAGTDIDVRAGCARGAFGRNAPVVRSRPLAAAARLPRSQVSTCSLVSHAAAAQQPPRA